MSRLWPTVVAPALGKNSSMRTAQLQQVTALCAAACSTVDLGAGSAILHALRSRALTAHRRAGLCAGRSLRMSNASGPGVSPPTNTVARQLNDPPRTVARGPSLHTALAHPTTPDDTRNVKTTDGYETPMLRGSRLTRALGHPHRGNSGASEADFISRGGLPCALSAPRTGCGRSAVRPIFRDPGIAIADWRCSRSILLARPDRASTTGSGPTAGMGA
ncbi:hypothetical protein J2W32_005476 [Variovorax boronicumulans]|uniref:Uncharacterized protein n=1 Tax=Variovorax boronicumulans TaxID=436515 RepID=A0AAW8D5C7_9BURK|nr:hypothetical protein [Variovorax boronicumulans]MDQ0056408.1 hypothetical protein [Variovorax boronicumulans]